MKLEITKIQDLEDGGALVTMEVDAEMLYFAFRKFMLDAIGAKIEETLGEGNSSEVVDEDELPSNPNPEEEEDPYEREMVEEFRKLADLELNHAVHGTDANVGFNDIPSADANTFWSDKPNSPGDDR